MSFKVGDVQSSCSGKISTICRVILLSADKKGVVEAMGGCKDGTMVPEYIFFKNVTLIISHGDDAKFLLE